MTVEKSQLKALGLWRPWWVRGTQQLGWGFFTVLLNRWCGLQIENAQVLGQLEQCIFAPTHASHLDFWAVLQGVPKALRKKTFVAAAKDYFYRQPLRGLITHLFSYQNFSLDRERASHVEYQRLCRMLKSGNSLLMFAQGTRTRDGNLLPFKPMLAMLAVDCQVPIVPVAVVGSFAAMPAGRFWPHRKKILVRFGQPFFPEALPDLKKLSKTAKKLNNDLMQMITTLYQGSL